MLENHLTPGDFFRFIDRGLEGCTNCPLERHLTACSECLEALDVILLADVQSDLAEELARWRLLDLTPKELLERLRPHIPASRAAWN